MSLIKNAVSEILLEQFEHGLEQLSDEEFFTREKVSMKINTTFDEKRAQTKFRKCASSNITLITGVDKQRVIKRIEKILKRT